MLSKEALSLLSALFSDKSTLSLPVGVAEQVVEIKKWIIEQEKSDASK